MLRRTRQWSTVALVAITLAACGGGDGTDPAVRDGSGTDPVGSASDGQDDQALATLALIDPSAEFRSDEVADFTSAEDGQPLDVGNVVRTDSSGFAIIEYVDGSVTRLDVMTEYQLVRLGGTAAAPEVEAQLDIGRAWHNTTDAAAEGEFTVRTPVATASVRGTVWLIECLLRNICTFSVVEGQVGVTPNGGDEVVLGPGEQITVTLDGGADPAGPVPADNAADGRDRFVDRNRARDLGQPDPGGDAPPGGVPAIRMVVDLGDALRVGDVVPLAYTQGLVVAQRGDHCHGGLLHVHVRDDASEAFFLGQGPFTIADEQPGDACGFGITMNAALGTTT